MMSLFLGEETVRKGVSNYLNEHKFGNAEQDDLWDSLTKEAHKNKVLPKDLDVKTIMDTWTLQTGYPVITAIRDYTKKTVQMSQVSILIFLCFNSEIYVYFLSTEKILKRYCKCKRWIQSMLVGST